MAPSGSFTRRYSPGAMEGWEAAAASRTNLLKALVQAGRVGSQDEVGGGALRLLGLLVERPEELAHLGLFPHLARQQIGKHRPHPRAATAPEAEDPNYLGGV